MEDDAALDVEFEAEVDADWPWPARVAAEALGGVTLAPNGVLAGALSRLPKRVSERSMRSPEVEAAAISCTKDYGNGHFNVMGNFAHHAEAALALPRLSTTTMDTPIHRLKQCADIAIHLKIHLYFVTIV